MSATDTARLPLLCTELRLPSVGNLWPAITEQADRDGWPAARTLAALFEHEVAERAQRRTQRHLAEARLPVGKTLDTFDFTAVPMISKARIAALGHALVDAGYRVLFTRTTDLVQQLQTARQELKLAGAIEKLDKYHLIVLDDLSYLQKNQAETSVLFELISARYERRSIMITANQPFGAWDQIFPDPAMTIATIDRLVHHSIIFEMNTDSYRRRTAQARKPE